MEYVLTAQAVRDLKRIDKPIQIHILEKLDWYVAQSDPLGFAQQLISADIGTFRFRVGDYRVVCDVEEETIVVLRIGHRSDIYR